MQTLVSALPIFMACSLFFVWVVRYDNIVQEFKTYKLPDWLRDFVGILKLSAAVLIVMGRQEPKLGQLGAGILIILMIAASSTHIWVKSPLYKRVPSFVLLVLALFLLLNYPK